MEASLLYVKWCDSDEAADDFTAADDTCSAWKYKNRPYAISGIQLTPPAMCNSMIYLKNGSCMWKWSVSVCKLTLTNMIISVKWNPSQNYQAAFCKCYYWVYRFPVIGRCTLSGSCACFKLLKHTHTDEDCFVQEFASLSSVLKLLWFGKGQVKGWWWGVPAAMKVQHDQHDFLSYQFSTLFLEMYTKLSALCTS